MFNWLLRLFGAGRAEVKEAASKVKAAAVDEVAERREAMETKAAAVKAKEIVSRSLSSPSNITSGSSLKDARRAVAKSGTC